MTRGAKRIVTILVGTIVGVGVVAGCGLAGYAFLAPRIDTYRHRVPFQPEGWKANSVDAGIWWPTRLRMADDLIARDLLKGCAGARVTELLGSPDTTSKFTDWDLVYRLGPERTLFSVDSEWLVIRLNARGVVADYRIVRD